MQLYLPGADAKQREQDKHCFMLVWRLLLFRAQDKDTKQGKRNAQGLVQAAALYTVDELSEADSTLATS